jgi:hypothetical protein
MERRCGRRLTRRHIPELERDAVAWRYCKKFCLKGADHCRTHGGQPRVGPASPNWRTGLYSDFLATGPLAAGYRHALADPNLRTLREQIALVSALEHEAVVSASAAGPSAGAWAAVARAMGELETGMRSKNAAVLAGALQQLRDAVGASASGRYARADIERLADLQRKLRAEEGHLMEREQRSFSLEQAIGLARRFAEIALRYIDEPDRRARCAAEIRAELTQRPSLILPRQAASA